MGLSFFGTWILVDQWYWHKTKIGHWVIGFWPCRFEGTLFIIIGPPEMEYSESIDQNWRFPNPLSSLKHTQGQREWIVKMTICVHVLCVRGCVLYQVVRIIYTSCDQLAIFLVHFVWLKAFNFGLWNWISV